MARNGLYARLFRLQASAYLGEVPDDRDLEVSA
jgi:hypothetical protein